VSLGEIVLSPIPWINNVGATSNQRRELLAEKRRRQMSKVVCEGPFVNAIEFMISAAFAPFQ
jgi:hypothetical protein